MSLLVEALWSRLQADASLTALVATRVYPNHEVPQGANLPYVSYGQVSDTPTHVFGGHSGLHTARWQFDVWDDSYLGAKLVAEQLRLTLDSSYGTNLGVDFHAFLVNQVDIPEAGLTDRFGSPVTHIAVDFMVQAAEPKPQEA